MSRWLAAFIPMVLASCQNDPGEGETESGKEAAEAAIRKNVKAYVSAYGEKDAAKLASMWSENGRFVDPKSGEPITGRKGIEAALGAVFDESGDVKLDVEIGSLRFLADNVAVEEGEATVTLPGQGQSVGSYQVIHVKEAGRWLIDSVRETAKGEVPPTEEAPPGEGEKEDGVPELEELAWMIGEWDDAGDNGTIQHSCRWGMWKSFIRRDFAVVIEGQVEVEGIEVIGWDPHEKQFRSWVFDSRGGFGTATWEKGDGEWLKKLSGTTQDGEKVFAVHVMKLIDENTFEFRAHGRESDGVILPNIDPVKVVRVTEGE